MASAIYDCSWPPPTSHYLHASFDTIKAEENPTNILRVLEAPTSSASTQSNIPAPPPPLPGSNLRKRKYWEKSSDSCYIPKETRDVWDTLFKCGYGANVCIITEHQETIPAHFSVLSIASPVLGNYLHNSKPKNGIKYLKIPGVPHGAVCTFIRFLYSSCYEEEDMKKFALHLLVLSHCFAVPLLKRVCVKYLENRCLTKENVIDVLQLARNCDAPRLSFICVRMVVGNFKSIAATEGWKIMRRVNPTLEQELLESVVEVDSRKEERVRKVEEKKVYMQLYEAMKALIHICKDGCSTIGPREKSLKGSQATCGYSACKGVETLVRHFFSCKTRVPGGCVQCKRMWQLLELHSRMCSEPEFCNVPLCRHFKDKMRHQSKKDEVKWSLLVRKLMEAKIARNPFGAQNPGFLMD